MATLVHIDQSKDPGRRVIEALQHIKTGIGVLREMDGTRAEVIGASQAEFVAIFGAGTNAEAQALSDRWAAVVAAFEDDANSEWGKLRDLIDATLGASGA